jgi:RNA polymerase sigma factor (sigma-70 family)
VTHGRLAPAPAVNGRAGLPILSLSGTPQRQRFGRSREVEVAGQSVSISQKVFRTMARSGVAAAQAWNRLRCVHKRPVSSVTDSVLGVKRFVRPVDRDDAELLGAVRSDPSAFAVFYDRYEVVVVGYLARRVRDPEVVADLTAEVFASALRSAPRYRPSEPTAAGWLITIAHNTLAKSLRRGRVEARARQRIGIRDAVRFEDQELERVEALATTDRWIIGLLDGLPREQAEAIRARVIEEREYPDIATELHTSELVIRKRVSRGLAALKREVEKEKQP